MVCPKSDKAKSPEDLKLVPLKPIDPEECRTLGQIIEGMSHCSFGARMVGKVFLTILGWIRSNRKPYLVYDGKPDSMLYLLLQHLVNGKKWFQAVVPSETLVNGGLAEENLVVVGRFDLRSQDELYARMMERTIFINIERLSGGKHYQEGRYRNIVFSDPSVMIPLLFHFLDEKLEGVTKSIPEIIAAMRPYGGAAEDFGRTFDILRHVFRPGDHANYLTVSGAMTIAQMGLVIARPISSGKVKGIVGTGALMAHDSSAGMGRAHYEYDPDISDEELHQLELNRVTDSLEPESNLDAVEEALSEAISEHLRQEDKLGRFVAWLRRKLGFVSKVELAPSEVLRILGKHLVEKYPEGRGIVQTAYRHSVPIYVPAFIDSEIANDLLIVTLKLEQKYSLRIIVNPELDSRKLIREFSDGSEEINIFTVGGGTSRNWLQNFGPLLDILIKRSVHWLKLQLRRFANGVLICPDPPEYGHLGGATHDEMKSWGKAHYDGDFAKLQDDATKFLPLLIRGLMDESLI